jgi:hypothetical protein
MTGSFQVSQDELWGKPCLAYNLQLEIEDGPSGALVDVQRALTRLLSVPLLLTPRETLHVSLFALVYVHWQAPDREAYWSRIAEPTGDLLTELCRTLPPVQLRFGGLRVTERAIFALASEPCATISTLRQQLAELLHTPDVPRPRHDIVHTTLARFAAPTTLDLEVVKAVQALPLDIYVTQGSARIVRELVYPSLLREEVQRFALAGSAAEA